MVRTEDNHDGVELYTRPESADEIADLSEVSVSVVDDSVPMDLCFTRFLAPLQIFSA
jgi:hypothetical protein